MVKDLISAGAEIELIIKISKLSREEIEEIKISLSQVTFIIYPIRWTIQEKGIA